jgi:exoribonuclease II|tara:strand:+ start:267 stop:512 length:246 start_codon:yes stop_codon:yes gene_type:complete
MDISVSLEGGPHRWQKDGLPRGPAYKYKVYHGDVLIHVVVTDGDEESVRKLIENNTTKYLPVVTTIEREDIEFPIRFGYDS